MDLGFQQLRPPIRPSDLCMYNETRLATLPPPKAVIDFYRKASNQLLILGASSSKSVWGSGTSKVQPDMFLDLLRFFTHFFGGFITT